MDHVKERLDKAEQIGAIPINYDEADPVEQIKSRRNGEGTDKGIDAVGYQATSAGSSAAGGEQDEVPNIVLNQLIDVVSPPERLAFRDCTSLRTLAESTPQAAKGALLINFGKLFETGSSTWNPASATSKATTLTCVISSSPDELSQISWCRTRSRSMKLQTPTRSSTAGKGITKVIIHP